MRKLIVSLLFILAVSLSFAQSPIKISQDGNYIVIDIGTTSPTSKLEVYGR